MNMAFVFSEPAIVAWVNVAITQSPSQAYHTAFIPSNIKPYPFFHSKYLTLLYLSVILKCATYMSENITIINLKCHFNSSIVHTKTDKHLLLIQRFHLLS